MSRVGLTPEQQASLSAFVNMHRAYEARREVAEQFAARRLQALADALDMGVPAVDMARATGLTHGRIGQMASQLGRTRTQKTPYSIVPVESSNGSGSVSRVFEVVGSDGQKHGPFPFKTEARQWIRRHNGVEVQP